MPAGPGIEGQRTGGGERAPEILQLADQGLGFREVLVDLQAALMQKDLQSADQREFRHAVNKPFVRLGRTAGNQHTDRADTGDPEHVENRPADPSIIDHQLGAGQPTEQTADMRDNAGIWRAQRHPLEITHAVDVSHKGNLSKSSTKARSIISLENAFDSGSMNSPSYDASVKFPPQSDRQADDCSACLSGVRVKLLPRDGELYVFA